MSAVIPGVTVLSEKRYNELRKETLVKTKIIIDHLDKLMRETMSDDKRLATSAFMKLGNIVASIQKINND